MSSTATKEADVIVIGLEPAGEVVGIGTELAQVMARFVVRVIVVEGIAGAGLFTHLATRQGEIVAAHILGQDIETLNLDALSAVTFTDPEVGAVGLTEAIAKAMIYAYPTFHKGVEDALNELEWPPPGAGSRTSPLASFVRRGIHERRRVGR